MRKDRAHAQALSPSRVFLAVVRALSLASAGQLQYTLLTLALPSVAGLDAVRWQWARLPFATVYFGGALFLLSMIPIA